MLLYCSKCNNLVDKIIECTIPRGVLIDRKCIKCGTENRYYVQYKAIIDRKWQKLPTNAKYASLELQ